MSSHLSKYQHLLESYISHNKLTDEKLDSTSIVHKKVQSTIEEIKITTEKIDSKQQEIEDKHEEYRSSLKGLQADLKGLHLEIQKQQLELVAAISELMMVHENHKQCHGDLKKRVKYF
jgi:peptidoglycan hydrolase CwlO-like protein